MYFTEAGGIWTVKERVFERIYRVRPVKTITSERRTAKLENTLKGLGKLEKNGCYSNTQSD